ncbi:hypothetical protein K443DRAFT_683706 [Laccaria amethystina LaAM-08-1]|uniref:Uncharacterized protein n=1 Tax=Laccaria amethystina LaAM-08-1 TaxID=1095629 RepID=A0A0C9XEF7_9AGAR|nr:hypothetical protein K443DRAFT_683706 [Laccaria amethystina LaAM-08-1]
MQAIQGAATGRLCPRAVHRHVLEELCDEQDLLRVRDLGHALNDSGFKGNCLCECVALPYVLS